MSLSWRSLCVIDKKQSDSSREPVGGSPGRRPLNRLAFRLYASTIWCSAANFSTLCRLFRWKSDLNQWGRMLICRSGESEFLRQRMHWYKKCVLGYYDSNDYNREISAYSKQNTCVRTVLWAATKSKRELLEEKEHRLNDVIHADTFALRRTLKMRWIYCEQSSGRIAKEHCDAANGIEKLADQKGRHTWKRDVVYSSCGRERGPLVQTVTRG